MTVQPRVSVLPVSGRCAGIPVHLLVINRRVVLFFLLLSFKAEQETRLSGTVQRQKRSDPAGKPSVNESSDGSNEATQLAFVLTFRKKS